MRLAWSRPLPAPPRELSLARETSTILLRDQKHYLSRLDRFGQLQASQPAPAPLVSARIADDGQSLAAIGVQGQIWWLTPDFLPLWQRSMSKRPVALALDVLGQRLAVADELGGVRMLDPDGRELWRTSVPRPLVHLAFVPEQPLLIGSAEYGLVCVFDAEGKLLWRDGLVAHVGGLAVTGDGSRVALACFTEGVHCYSANSPKRHSLTRAAPTRLVALDYLGELLITTGLENELARRGVEGDIRSVLMLPSRAISLCVDALGTMVWAACSDGSLVGVELLRSL